MRAARAMLAVLAVVLAAGPALAQVEANRLRGNVVVIEGRSYVVRPIGGAEALERQRLMEGELAQRDVRGRLSSCGQMIELPAPGDHVYGADCKLDQFGTITRILLCDETVYSRFRAIAVGTPPPPLIPFTAASCGGP